MKTPPERKSRAALVQALQAQVDQLEGRRAAAAGTCSSGLPALDRLLPAGGFRRGSLVEWLAAEAASGAETLSLFATRQACGEDRTALVVMDRRGGFYPPAAAAWGISLESLILVRPANAADELWAWDQCLRCPAVGAVWGLLDRLDSRGFRRLQLAAEEGGALGLLVRPARARREPAWSDIRLAVRPGEGGPCFQIELVRGRRGARPHVLEVELDPESGHWRERSPNHAARDVPVASRLAPAKPARRAT